MTTIHVTTHSRLAPERVLAAGYDFSARRAEIFPAVSTPALRGPRAQPDLRRRHRGHTGRRRHQLGAMPVRLVAARFSQGGRHRFERLPAGGSSWELRATPAESGSEVEMIWIREFTHNARGRIFGTLFKLIGKPIFRRYVRDTLENLRQLEQPGR